MNIFPTVKIFSNMDIASGRVYPQPFFYYTQNFQDVGDVVQLGGGIQIFKNKGEIKIGQQQLPIKDFYHVAYNEQGKTVTNKQSVNPQSPISVIFMRSYNTFIVLEDEMLNSTYIQLFVFQNFDPELFEPVILHPLAKIYKLKR